jgi:hypothetical protein
VIFEGYFAVAVAEDVQDLSLQLIATRTTFAAQMQIFISIVLSSDAAVRNNGIIPKNDGPTVR